mgnify:CR=1 FL=1
MADKTKTVVISVLSVTTTIFLLTSVMLFFVLGKCAQEKDRYKELAQKHKELGEQAHENFTRLMESSQEYMHISKSIIDDLKKKAEKKDTEIYVLERNADYRRRNP